MLLRATLRSCSPPHVSGHNNTSKRIEPNDGQIRESEQSIAVRLRVRTIEIEDRVNKTDVDKGQGTNVTLAALLCPLQLPRATHLSELRTKAVNNAIKGKNEINKPTRIVAVR